MGEMMMDGAINGLDTLLTQLNISSSVDDVTATMNEPVQLEPYQWKEIRLFLSSSFIDTQAERDAIIKQVIPSLNRKLADKFIRIVPIDLRWGVLNEESKNCDAIQKTCLNQLDNCRQNIDEYPWFLGLRTNRYGWVQDTLLAAEHYNHPERYDWVKGLQEHEKRLSITSLECIHATSQLPIKPNKPTIFFYERMITNEDEIEGNMRWIFDFEYVTPDKELSSEVQNQYVKTESATMYKNDRNALNEYLKNLEYVQYRTYECRYEKTVITGEDKVREKKFGVGYVNQLDDFIRLIENDLYESITGHFKMADISVLPEHEKYNAPHEIAAKLKSLNFVGRTSLVEKCYDQFCAFVRPKAKKKPKKKKSNTLIVHGEPGCGKSALVANIATKCLDDLRKNGDFVFTHLVDSCPGSNSLERMLSRLHLSLTKYREELGEVNAAKTCPRTAAELRKNHVAFVKESADRHPEKQFVILIDAVNQFHSSLDAFTMWWLLPSEGMPRNLRLLISTLNEENATFVNACAVCPNAELVPVTDISRKDGEEIVAKLLGTYNKKLTTWEDGMLGNQMKLLLDKNLSPLYLTAAANTLRRFGIYEKLTGYINDLPPVITDLFGFLLQAWCSEYDEVFVRDVCTILCLSKDGLLENEINDLIAFIEEKEGFNYICSFARFYDCLSPFLAAGGGGYLSFFHAQLKKVVRKQYVDGNDEFEERTHIRFKDFYLHQIRSQLCDKPTVEPVSYYRHCLKQIVHHQLMLRNKWNVDFINTLRNVYFVRERIKHRQENLLQQEYVAATRKYDGEKPLKDWAKFVSIYAPHIDSYKEWVHNMAINQYPNTAVYIDTCKLPHPEYIDRYPLHWSNIVLKNDDIMVLKYESFDCRACAVSANFVCCAFNNVVCLYEQNSGVLVHHVEVPDVLLFDAVYIPVHCNQFWACDHQANIHVWNIATGCKEKTFNVGEGSVKCIVHAGEYVACLSTKSGWVKDDLKYSNTKISIIDEKELDVVRSFPLDNDTQDLVYDPHHNQLISGHKDMIRFWNLNGEMTKSVEVVGGAYNIALHPIRDDTIAITSEKWKNGEIRILRQNGDVINSITTDSDVYYNAAGEIVYVDGDVEDRIIVCAEDGTSVRKADTGVNSIKKMLAVPGSDELFVVSGYGGCALIRLPPTPTSNETSNADDGKNADDDKEKGVDDDDDVYIWWCGFIGNGDEFCIFDGDKLNIWNTATQKQDRSIEWEKLLEEDVDELVCGHAHPDTKHLIIYSKTNLYWMDIKSMEVVATNHIIASDEDNNTADEEEDGGHQIHNICISPDGNSCIINALKYGMVYDISNMTAVKRTHMYELNVQSKIKYSDIHKDNDTAVGCRNGRVELWSLSSGKTIRGIVKEKDVLKVNFLHETDRIIYTDMKTQKTNMVDMNGKNPVELFTGQIYHTTNGSIVISFDRLGIHVYDTTTGEEVSTFLHHELGDGASMYCDDEVTMEMKTSVNCALHPDNKMLIVWNDEGKVFFLTNDQK